ncbi:MAG: hypothetical protein CENE_02795 [Candidatus Celerinatantimonas neptuna]|nr:MAG: hypothetical protein CENE_02795 [Candidatus Celerinatantimonas neptuna]
MDFGVKSHIRKQDWPIKNPSLFIVTSYPELRLFREKAGLVIFIDLPLRVCLRRMIWRMIKINFKSRPELPKGCNELKAAQWVFPIMLKFHKNVRPKIYKDMKNIDHMVLTNPAEIENFIVNFNAQTTKYS